MLEHQHAQLQRQPGNRMSRVPMKGPAGPPGPNFYAQKKRKNLFLLLGRLLSGLRRIGLVLLRVRRRIGFLVAGTEAWSIAHSNFLSKYLKTIVEVHVQAGA